MKITGAGRVQMVKFQMAFLKRRLRIRQIKDPFKRFFALHELVMDMNRARMRTDLILSVFDEAFRVCSNSDKMKSVFGAPYGLIETMTDMDLHKDPRGKQLMDQMLPPIKVSKQGLTLTQAFQVQLLLSARGKIPEA